MTTRRDEVPADLFADFLVERREGAELDVGPLCARHPEHAAAFREMALAWAELDAAHREAFGDHQSLRTSLAGAPVNGLAETAQELYAEYLLARRGGARTELADLIEAHPEHAAGLRRLHEHWQRVEQVFGQLGQGSRLDTTFFLRNAEKALGGEELREQRTRDLVRLLLERRGSGSRYEVCREIGRGGMARVLEVSEPTLRRKLAMKVLRDAGPGLADASRGGPLPSRVVRFLEEAQVTGQLDHPGIVPVHELGLDQQGNPFFTMKRVHGRDLTGVYRDAWEGRGRWSVPRVLDVLLRVCEALAFAHAKGVVHRDLKPANVMIGRYGEVYVMDWGLAKVVGRMVGGDLERPDGSSLSLVETDRAAEADGHHTVDGDVLGTPAYMPPEQAMGECHRVSPAADVYAVGAMLYHLLARRPPYVGSDGAASPREILDRVRTGPPAPLAHAVGRSVPPELIAIVDRAMQRDVTRRYGNLHALAEDLRAFTEGRVVRAYRTGPVAELSKWVARNRGVAGTSLLSIASLVGVLAMLTTWNRAQAVGAQRGEQQARDELTSVRVQLDHAREDIEASRAELEQLSGVKRVLEQENHRLRSNMDSAREGLEDVLTETRRELDVLEAVRVDLAIERDAFARLSIVRRLDEVLASQSDLFPVADAQAQAVEAWLDRASGLVTELSGLEQDLAELRARAVRPEAGSRTAEFGDSAEAREVARLEARVAGVDRELEQLDASLASDPEDTWLDLERRRFSRKREETLEQLEQAREALADLEPIEFSDPADAWRHEQLESLLRSRDELRDPERGLIERVQSRLQRAREAFACTSEHAAAWRRASEEIADRSRFPMYAGLSLSPQAGLVPLGPWTRDEECDALYQFWHVASGSRPELDGRGEPILTPQSGLVMVLVPPGSYVQGARRGPFEADGTVDVNPDARDDEAPGPDAVTLGPFFLSRFEVTQAQWQRWTSSQPSFFVGPSADPRLCVDAMHPVESVSWIEAGRVLEELDLSLPTEAQWEWACRGGRTTPWWSGATRRTLRGVNVADRVAGNPMRRIDGWAYETGYEDGHDTHAPIDALTARHPWGLEAITGNVAEWCRDGYVARYGLAPPRLGDGLRVAGPGAPRVVRGGSFATSLGACRSAYRRPQNERDTLVDVGLRPSRPVW